MTNSKVLLNDSSIIAFSVLVKLELGFTYTQPYKVKEKLSF